MLELGCWYLGQESPLLKKWRCPSGRGTGHICRHALAWCYLRIFLAQRGNRASSQDKRVHTGSTQCGRRIKSQEYRWCVVTWMFPWLCKEITSCVPCVAVLATGLSLPQTTIIQNKMLLSNEKVHSNMCIRHLCAIYLYFL